MPDQHHAHALCTGKVQEIQRTRTDRTGGLFVHSGNPEHPFHSEEFLSYYTNYSCEKQTDNLLIYATDKDSLLATIPIEQAAAPHVTVTKTETEVNAVTLTLKGQNEARYYSAYLSTDSIPLYQVIEDLKTEAQGFLLIIHSTSAPNQPAHSPD